MSLPPVQPLLAVPYISDERLERTADQFLVEYGCSGKMPVNVEHICDQAGIGLLAIPNLSEELGVDAYIADRCQTIVIDEACFIGRVSRARFSIAHELGHYILHRKYYLAREIHSIEGYMQFHASIQEEVRKRIEIQAYVLAGHILMPRPLFNKEIQNSIEQLGGASNLTVRDAQVIADELCQTFEVSHDALFRQASKIHPAFYSKLLER